MGMVVSFPAYSMFSATPVYQIGSDVVLGLMRDVVIPDASDTLYTVTEPGSSRFDLISNMFYGTCQLWWVIARVNNIMDPLLGVAPGTVLRIPTRDRLSRQGVLTS